MKKSVGFLGNICIVWHSRQYVTNGMIENILGDGIKDQHLPIHRDRLKWDFTRNPEIANCTSVHISQLLAVKTFKRLGL